MSLSEQDRLIRMINQIAINNSSAGDDNAVARVVANHVKKFWSRRMKEQLAGLPEEGLDRLQPSARLAAEQLGNARLHQTSAKDG